MEDAAERSSVASLVALDSMVPVNTTALVATVLASSVVVFGGLWRLTRAIWRVAQDLRDNKAATVKNTEALAGLSIDMMSRVTNLESWRQRIENQMNPRATN